MLFYKWISDFKLKWISDSVFQEQNFLDSGFLDSLTWREIIIEIILK